MERRETVYPALAYSTDGGETLHKIDKGVLPTVCKENRDPKVFWHEKSGAYIMTLWLEERFWHFSFHRSAKLGTDRPPDIQGGVGMSGSGMPER